MRQLTRVYVLLAAGLALGLAACAPAPRTASYRGQGQRLYSIVAFSPERFAGTWHEVAGFYDPAQQGCALGLTAAKPSADGLSLSFAGCAGPAGTVPAKRVGLARFVPEGGGARSEPWWILWVDQDYRTAVIGTPSGHWGAILNRTPDIPADRLKAARQILEFNGYDVSRLRPH